MSNKSVTLTAKHSNGAPETEVSGATVGEARNLMAAQMIRLYGDDVYLDYCADRGLVWQSEEDSIDDDDGASAVAEVYEKASS